MPIVHFLNRLFNIHTRAWPRVLWLFTMAFIAIVGITWGKLTVQPLFWRQVGIDSLGYAFAVEGGLAILAVAIYTLFADRIANERLLLGIALLSAAVGSGRLALASDTGERATFCFIPFSPPSRWSLTCHGGPTSPDSMTLGRRSELCQCCRRMHGLRAR